MKPGTWTVAVAAIVAGSGCLPWSRGPCGDSPCHQDASIVVVLATTTTEARAAELGRAHGCRVSPGGVEQHPGAPALDCATICISGPEAIDEDARASELARVRRAFAGVPEVTSVEQIDGPIC